MNISKSFIHLISNLTFVLLCGFSDMSCFQGLFFCPEACSLLLHNFCIYHISPPGHEVCNSITEYISCFCLIFLRKLLQFSSIDSYSHKFLCRAFFKNYFSLELQRLALMILRIPLMIQQIRLPKFSTFLGNQIFMTALS